LIASKNNPKVKTVTGSVSTIKIGLKNRFNIEIATATTAAVIKESTVTPGIKYADKVTAIDDKINFTRKFILIFI